MFEKVYDLCIVGGGPAGIIVALEYSRLNPVKQVLLIEFGKADTTPRNHLDDSIVVKNEINHHLPYECTNKGLGGTSASWGGRCVMYDEVDFVDRPILRDGCTWDLKFYADALHHTSKASEYFECGSPEFNLHTLQGISASRIAENFQESDITDTVLERWSKPTRFGRRYRKALQSLPHVTLLEGYEARTFSDPDGDGIVSSLSIRNCYTKENCQVVARRFVLSAGTQETTRLLLRNKNLFKNLSMVPTSLGKYYQGHLSGKIASVQFYGDPRKTDYGFKREIDGTYVRRRFQFTSDFLVKNNLLNTALWLDNPLYFDPSHRSGSMSLMYLAMITPLVGKKLAPPAIAQSVTKGKRFAVSSHILNVLRDFPGSLTTTASIFYKRYCTDRKLPGVFLYSKHNRYALHFHSEQIPLRSNQMELGEDGESLLIHYELSDDDIYSVIELHKKLDRHLQECKCGHLDYWFPEEELPQAIRMMSKDGIHQSGTTRIADSPEKGVVDRDLRVFGTRNVYLCSSSTFPTSSQANPTFFLGVLAVRLAAHLTITPHAPGSAT